MESFFNQQNSQEYGNLVDTSFPGQYDQNRVSTRDNSTHGGRNLVSPEYMNWTSEASSNGRQSVNSLRRFQNMNRVPSFMQFNHLEQNLLHHLRAEPFNVSINPSEDDVNSGDTVAPVQNLPILSRIANNVRNMIPFVNNPPPPRDETIPNLVSNVQSVETIQAMENANEVIEQERRRLVNDFAILEQRDRQALEDRRERIRFELRHREQQLVYQNQLLEQRHRDQRQREQNFQDQVLEHQRRLDEYQRTFGNPDEFRRDNRRESPPRRIRNDIMPNNRPIHPPKPRRSIGSISGINRNM